MPTAAASWADQEPIAPRVSGNPPGRPGTVLAEGSPVGRLDRPGIDPAEGTPVGRLDPPGIEVAEGTPPARLDPPGIELAEGMPVGRLDAPGIDPAEGRLLGRLDSPGIELAVGRPDTLEVPDLPLTHAFTPWLLDEWVDPLPIGVVTLPEPDAVPGVGSAGAFGVFTQCELEEGFGREAIDEIDAGDTGLGLAPLGSVPIVPSANADNPAAPATRLVVRLLRVIGPLCGSVHRWSMTPFHSKTADVTHTCALGSFRIRRRS